MSVNWSDHNSRLTDHFTVHEALWLPSWRVYHVPSETEKQEILQIARVMERIRAIFDKPIMVHCWMRPNRANCPGHARHGQDYNKFIGSTATRSAHIFGRAVDFHVATYSGGSGCDRARETLRSHLSRLGIRMEGNTGGGWIHIDNYPNAGTVF